MAIYSCNLSSIGKTTHAVGTAGAHVRYIARPEARPVILSSDMPYDPVEARTFIDQQERSMRKNGRVLDKIRIALPRELDDVQRAELVENFMADLCGDKRVPWFAGIHQTGKDEHNPHVHIDVHDRDLETGKRVLRLSDNARDRTKAGLPGPKAVDWIRERWEVVANDALLEAGHDVRIDRRTLKAQGIDRKPTIHEGPGGQHINDNVTRPESKVVINGAGRVIDYPLIDKGVTRREFNAQIIDFNLERAVRSDNFDTAVWAQFEKDQYVQDRQLEDQLAIDRRQQTAERRAVSAKYRAPEKRVSAELRLKTRQAQKTTRAEYAPKREDMRARQQQERKTLRRQHKRMIARIARRLSRTIRDRQLAARRAQITAHRAQRQKLSQSYQLARKQAQDALIALYSVQTKRIQEKRAEHLTQVDAKHSSSRQHADILRQRREATREEARQLTEAKIQDFKQQEKLKKRGSDSPTKADFKEVALTEEMKQRAIKRAFEKVQKQEDEKGSRSGESEDRGRSR